MVSPPEGASLAELEAFYRKHGLEPAIPNGARAGREDPLSLFNTDKPIHLNPGDNQVALDQDHPGLSVLPWAGLEGWEPLPDEEREERNQEVRGELEVMLSRMPEWWADRIRDQVNGLSCAQEASKRGVSKDSVLRARVTARRMLALVPRLPHCPDAEFNRLSSHGLPPRLAWQVVAFLWCPHTGVLGDALDVTDQAVRARLDKAEATRLPGSELVTLVRKEWPTVTRRAVGSERVWRCGSRQSRRIIKRCLRAWGD